MAPPNAAGKRVKGVQIFRPFIYGTTARPFDEKSNPKPPDAPDDHTHSWTVFVKGIDDTDITYWLRRVQFKLHESIPQHVRMIDGEMGQPFEVHETGWGEFEIAIKLYYVSESSEKPQTIYHHLRLHPYGRTDEERDEMARRGVVTSWIYEEQLFNDPYEAFYEILTTGATPSGKGKGKQATRSPGGVLERSAMIPLHSREGHPFSRDTERAEILKLEEALKKVDEMMQKQREELKQKEARLAELRSEV